MDKRIAFDTLPDGNRVSTVRLPFPHHGGQYETMVFPPDNYRELDMERYHTAEEAEAGHARMVAKWRNGTPTETTSFLDHDGPIGALTGALQMIALGAFGDTEEDPE